MPSLWALLGISPKSIPLKVPSHQVISLSNAHVPTQGFIVACFKHLAALPLVGPHCTPMRRRDKEHIQNKLRVRGYVATSDLSLELQLDGIAVRLEKLCWDAGLWGIVPIILCFIIKVVIAQTTDHSSLAEPLGTGRRAHYFLHHH